MRTLAALVLLVSLAVADEPPVPESLGKPGPPPAEASVDDLTVAYSKKLRCPVCQGMSVADSPSESAVTMKGRIRELVAEGYSEEQIQGYFITRYGEWVLLAPTTGGANAILWLGPAILLGGGLVIAGAYAAQWRKEPDDALPSERGEAPLDPYEERLLAELDP